VLPAPPVPPSPPSPEVPPSVLVVVQRRPLYTAGRTSYLNELIEAVGNSLQGCEA